MGWGMGCSRWTNAIPPQPELFQGLTQPEKLIRYIQNKTTSLQNTNINSGVVEENLCGHCRPLMTLTTYAARKGVCPILNCGRRLQILSYYMFVKNFFCGRVINILTSPPINQNFELVLFVYKNCILLSSITPNSCRVMK